MENIIIEQATDPCKKVYQYKDALIKDGFIPQNKLPQGFVYSRTDHCFKIFQSITYYRRKDGQSLAGGGVPPPPTPSPSTTNLSDYVGEYREKTTKAILKVIEDGGNLKLSYSVIKDRLEPDSGDVFTLRYANNDFKITFNRDVNNKVNLLSATLLGKNIVAEKITSSNNSSTSGNSGTSGSSGSAGSSGTSSSSGTPTVVQYTKYNVVTPEERLEGFKWHDCENKDFPYEFGCKNTYIGQMNTCLFGKELNGIFGSELWENMKDLGFNEPKKEITKKMYDMVMLNCKKQEESIERKKIIKENTYKILKQLK